MNRPIYLFLLLCLLAAAAPALAANRPWAALCGRDSLITARNATVESRDGRIIVRFVLCAPAPGVRRDYRHLLTPQLAVADSTLPVLPPYINKVLLTPLSPVGKRKSRSEHRRAVLGGRAASRHRLLKARPRLSDTTHYEISLPYEEWMGFHPLSLRLHREKATYLRSWYLSNEPLLCDIRLLPPWQRTVPLLPPVSGAETRTTQLARSHAWLQATPCCQQPPRYLNLLLPPDGALRLDFRLGSTRLHPNQADNQNTLRELNQIREAVGADHSVRIDRITLLGQAVSDGDRLLETRLSDKRAQAVKQFLTQTLQIDPAQIDVYTPTDLWESLRTQIEYSALPATQKQQVLDIIDHTPDAAEREHRLLALDDGTAYAYVKNHLLPGLRDAVYVQLHYTDLSDPNRTQLNRAIELMNRGDYAAALAMLQELPADARSTHLRGICRLLGDATLASLLEGKLQLDPTTGLFIIGLDEASEQLTTDLPEQNEINLDVLFRVGSSHLDSCFADNAAALLRLHDIVGATPAANRRLVRHVRITGEASPEGGYGTNIRLSIARAQALKTYLLQHVYLADAQIEVAYTEPSWNDLRESVKADRHVPYRRQVIQIIDQTYPGADRDAQLRQLGNGRAYRYLNEHLLHRLRNAACVQVTFEHLTDAHRPIINRAIAEIRRGHYAAAIALLEPIQSDSRTALPLRVARIMNQPNTPEP